MAAQVAFFASITLSFLAWGMVTSRYVWPRLRLLSATEAMQPLLIVHSFRFLGLAFLVPSVVSPDLPPAFSHPAAYGDVIAALLALLSLLTRLRGIGVLVAWIFSLWGTGDLLNAFYRANASGLEAGQLSATYFIPTLVVPMLLITHALVFRLLLQPSSEPAARRRQLAT